MKLNLTGFIFYFTLIISQDVRFSVSDLPFESKEKQSFSSLVYQYQRRSVPIGFSVSARNDRKSHFVLSSNIATKRLLDEVLPVRHVHSPVIRSYAMRRLYPVEHDEPVS